MRPADPRESLKEPVLAAVVVAVVVDAVFVDTVLVGAVAVRTVAVCAVVVDAVVVGAVAVDAVCVIGAVIVGAVAVAAIVVAAVGHLSLRKYLFVVAIPGADAVVPDGRPADVGGRKTAVLEEGDGRQWGNREWGHTEAGAWGRPRAYDGKEDKAGSITRVTAKTMATSGCNEGASQDFGTRGTQSTVLKAHRHRRVRRRVAKRHILATGTKKGACGPKRRDRWLQCLTGAQQALLCGSKVRENRQAARLTRRGEISRPAGIRMCPGESNKAVSRFYVPPRFLPRQVSVEPAGVLNWPRADQLRLPAGRPIQRPMAGACVIRDADSVVKPLLGGGWVCQPNSAASKHEHSY